MELVWNHRQLQIAGQGASSQHKEPQEKYTDMTLFSTAVWIAF